MPKQCYASCNRSSHACQYKSKEQKKVIAGCLSKNFVAQVRLLVAKSSLVWTIAGCLTPKPKDRRHILKPGNPVQQTEVLCTELLAYIHVRCLRVHETFREFLSGLKGEESIFTWVLRRHTNQRWKVETICRYSSVLRNIHIDQPRKPHTLLSMQPCSPCFSQICLPVISAFPIPYSTLPVLQI